MENDEILIGIVPVGNVGGQLLDDIIIGVKEVLMHTFNDDDMEKRISCRPIPPRPTAIPGSAYQENIGKYNVNKFIDLAMTIKSKADRKLNYFGREITKTLVITNVPLYSLNINSAVFGEALINGDYAVVSLYQLENNALKEDIRERTIKECIHELGHTFGLRHCNEEKCVMRQSLNMYEVDKKSSHFCESCKRQLKSMQFSKDYGSWKG